MQKCLYPNLFSFLMQSEISYFVLVIIEVSMIQAGFVRLTLLSRLLQSML